MSFLRGFIALFAAVTLTACDSDDNIFVPVQFIHAVANAPSVDISNGAQVLYTDVDFKQATGFDPILYGSTSIAVDANLPGGAEATVIGPANISLIPGSRYSVIAAGSVGSMATPVQAIVVDDVASPVTAGNVRVQVVHAAAGAPPVDIHVTGPLDPIVPVNAIAGGSTPFGAVSGQIEVPAGDYRVRVTLPGMTDALFDSGTVALPAGADLLVIAVDNTLAGRTLTDAAPISLLVADGESQFEIVDQNTPAEVRVVHAVPDANEVDVYVNDSMAMNAPAIEDLDFTEIVVSADEYIAFDPGTINVLVTGANNPGFIAIPATDIELEAGEQYTVYASGTVASGIEPFVTGDDDRPVATESRVRIVHLAPGAGLVDVYVTAPMTDINTVDPAIESFDFRDDTGYLSLDPGSYDVSVTLAGTKTVAIGPATVTLDAGGVYTAVARDPDVDVGNDPFGLILLDDF